MAKFAFLLGVIVGVAVGGLITYGIVKSKIPFLDTLNDQTQMLNS